MGFKLLTGGEENVEIRFPSKDSLVSSFPEGFWVKILKLGLDPGVPLFLQAPEMNAHPLSPGIVLFPKHSGKVVFFFEACLSLTSLTFRCPSAVDIRARRLGGVATHQDSRATLGTRPARLRAQPSPWKGKWDQLQGQHPRRHRGIAGPAGTRIACSAALTASTCGRGKRSEFLI